MNVKQFVKRPWFGGRIFWSLPCDEPMVALTFDDGPHNENTARILDILHEHNAKASFFCVGQAARLRPDLVKRITHEGHTLASHTDTHADLSTIGSKRAALECQESRKTLEEISGKSVRFLRPPWGKLSVLTVPIILANKMRVAMWSVDSLDWKLDPPEALIARLRSRKLVHGDVILLHDDYAETVEALPQILSDIESRGLKCVSLDQLSSLISEVAPKYARPS